MAYLGSDQYLASLACYSPANRFFRAAALIGIGGVDKIDSCIQCCLDNVFCGFEIYFAPKLVGTQADG